MASILNAEDQVSLILKPAESLVISRRSSVLKKFSCFIQGGTSPAFDWVTAKACRTASLSLLSYDADDLEDICYVSSSRW